MITITLPKKETEALAYAARELAENYRINGGNARVVGRTDYAEGWERKSKEYSRLSEKLYALVRTNNQGVTK